MCGITGIFNFSNSSINQSLIHEMSSRLVHRGPDDTGSWSDNTIFLGFKRLAIHDLTSAGLQPMLSADKNWIIVFNGEIYNYKTLRDKISAEKNIQFVSQSDTEILVNAISLWGMEKTLQECVGMFSIAAYCISEKKLVLARDRFGEKPLYFGLQNKLFAFASELKALKPLQHVGWQFEIDRQALSSYMRYGYVPTPHCIFKHIHKLNPGHIIEIDSHGNQKQYTYWNSHHLLEQDKFSGDYQDAVSSLDTLLKQSVHLQMESDVPLGAFLSGGVDSSTIVALMQAQSTQKINTFSIGFHEAEFNEANYASAVAKYLGTNHTEVYVSEKDALNVIPLLPHMYDEPFADSSQIPTYLVSKIAKTAVTVSLSGDAGDELFGGYNRYLWAQKIKSTVLDHAVIKKIICHAPINLIKPFSILMGKYIQPIDKLLKLQNIIRHSKNSEFDLYNTICSQLYPNTIVKDAHEYSIFHEKHLFNTKLPFQEWMMFADLNTYMTDDILTKVDRAAMAVSLETRVPFLDHRIVEFAWRLPMDYKIQNNNGKRILKDVLYRYVPKNLIDRPKMGFGVPLAKWLRTDLKPWADDLLNPDKIKKDGFLDEDIVNRYWREHLSGKRNWQAPLWNILMFQLWLETWRDA